MLAQLLNQKTVSYPCEKWTPVLVQAGQTGQTDIERHGDAEDNVELETKEQLQNRFISRVFQGKIGKGPKDSNGWINDEGFSCTLQLRSLHEIMHIDCFKPK